MKKLMMILMMLVVTLTATSQGLGDSYNDFLNSDTNFEQGLDSDGEGFLSVGTSTTSLKYYFKDGICNYTMFISYSKKNTDEVFNSWVKNVTNQYEAENGYMVYEVDNYAKFIYHYKYKNGRKLYILEAFTTN
jgi:hypothetical protein